ncbi:hypothetical protein HKT18_02400 [Flavobacterium sp. IMCC34852]|uniref:Uncharacterized protein n=1 Tax=Flavobacterium rivulicola TaxID=2732161 RepID=A0A7Y3VXZ9_9FLAO|nr:hypothetical protein [Flavobacterium sp. IMCC34852]NNT71057.1 hypothetical protein [Flavobacterium sp. IMCC34852]
MRLDRFSLRIGKTNKSESKTGNSFNVMLVVFKENEELIMKGKLRRAIKTMALPNSQKTAKG